MSDPQTAPAHGPRTAREVLVAQLIGDVDRLLDRVDAIAPAIDIAAARLEHAAAALEAATCAHSEAAKASVGEYITRRTNEATEAARAHVRAAAEALATARACHAHAPSAPSSADRSPESRTARPTRRGAWVACMLAAAFGALTTVTAMLALTPR